ncbi:MAG: LTA synthase family protein [Lachnospiraceae bacterium]|nr:LTA synthase family protein [Lachnospiraceae bacterium]
MLHRPAKDRLVFFFAAGLFIPYLETVLRFSTTGAGGALPYLATLLFSAGYSLILALVVRLASSERANRILTGAVLFLVPFFYGPQYFIYRSFQVFYDTQTIVNGVGGVVSGFLGDTARLVFSPDGIFKIILLLAPFLAYVLYGRRVDPAPRHDAASVRILSCSGVICLCLALGAVSLSEPLRLTYDTEYNYESAVEELGLITGFRLDLRKLMRGDAADGDFEFEMADAATDPAGTEAATTVPETIPGEGGGMPSASTTPQADPAGDDNGGGSGSATAAAPATAGTAGDAGTENGADGTTDTGAEKTADTEEPEPDYGYNQSDIDFEALAASTKNAEWQKLDRYVASIPASRKNRYTGLFEGKNLIFFTAEAFSGSVIDPELTPTLYRLAERGIRIPDYYQPAVAGTTGGEYANLFGMIPTAGGKSMKEITAHNTSVTLGNLLNDRGYFGKAYHNNSRTVYGRNETHNRLGYSDGFTGVGNGLEKVLTGTGFPASDREMVEGTLPDYIGRQPFNIYYMTVSGHGQYGKSVNRMSAKNYDRVADLPYSEQVKGYIANNLELEDALAVLVKSLEDAGIADDTVIVLGADHFPYGLDRGASPGPGNMPTLSELYGYDVTNALERDHNRLIIWCGSLEKQDPVTVDTPVFSLDILPTLCNLFGLPYESRILPGRDIFSDREPLIFNGGYDWKTDKGTFLSSKGKFIPADPDEVLPEGYVENVKKEVRNRMQYCKRVLSSGYFDHVFGE